MKTLIFNTGIAGHHLEYLHHYYIGALGRPEHNFVFVIPRKFEEVKDKYDWPQCKNIEILYIDAKYDTTLEEKNPYRLGWNTSKILKDYSEQIKPDRILLTMLMQYIPFILFLLPSSIKVSGILYQVYLYNLKNLSFFRRLLNFFIYLYTAKSKRIANVFVLNDVDSALAFNKKFHTNKFKFLPDPVPEIEKSSLKNLRSELEIPKENKVFLHFGGLDKRKGTLDILKAINLLSKEDARKFSFIFAGKQHKEIKKEFSNLHSDIKDICQVLIFDEFCSYEFLYNLCYTCDVILMPYTLTNLSSGVLGYASVFGKPVIGPSSGLLGNIIKNYKLGICLKNISPENIKEGMLLEIHSEGFLSYSKKNSISEFINILYS